MPMPPERPSLPEEPEEEEDLTFARYGALARRIKLLRRQLFVERVVFIALILALLIVVLLQRRPALAWVISVNGEPIVAVADRQTAQSLLAEIKQEQAPILSEPGPIALKDADFQEAVSIIRVKALDHQVIPADQAREKLAQLLTTVVPGYAIMVEGKVAVALPTKRGATRCLSQVQARYAPEPGREESPPRFKESVNVHQMTVPACQLEAKIEEAVKVLLQGTSRTITYQVKQGDSAWIIARRYQVRVSDLEKLNPNRDLERLQVGDRLLVGGAQPWLTVVTQERRTLTEPIPFPTESIRTDSLRRGTRKVVQRGKPGKREVEVVVTLENRREVERAKISQRVLEEPVPKKVLIGTKVPRGAARSSGRRR